jgi:hypothetical protein
MDVSFRDWTDARFLDPGSEFREFSGNVRSDL